MAQVTDKLANANRSFLAGAFRHEGSSLPVVAGQTLQGVPDIGLLLLTSRDGRPVYVKDVADVCVGAILALIGTAIAFPPWREGGKDAPR